MKAKDLLETLHRLGIPAPAWTDSHEEALELVEHGQKLLCMEWNYNYVATTPKEVVEAQLYIVI